MEPVWKHFSSQADNLHQLNQKISDLNLSFEFWEMENHEQVFLEPIPKTSMAISDNIYRGRLFGKNGQVEFRRVGEKYFLSAILQSDNAFKDWEPGVLLCNSREETYYLTNNPKGYAKAKIREFRKKDHRMVAACWQEVF